MVSSSLIAVPETPVFNTGLVSVLLVSVSVVALPTSVSVALGKVTVTSPLKPSAIVSVASCASCPSPSKIMSAPVLRYSPVLSNVAIVPAEPLVITLKSICPSSVPSLTSSALACILA